MIRTLLAIILTSLLAFVAGLFLDWWSIALAAFIVSLLLYQRPILAFFSGFFGIFILWGIIALWKNIENDGILATKIANLLPLGGSDALLILVTAVIGALVGGLAGITGSYLRTPAPVSSNH